MDHRIIYLLMPVAWLAFGLGLVIFLGFVRPERIRREREADPAPRRANRYRREVAQLERAHAATLTNLSAELSAMAAVTRHALDVIAARKGMR